MDRPMRRDRFLGTRDGSVVRNAPVPYRDLEVKTVPALNSSNTADRPTRSHAASSAFAWSSAPDKRVDGVVAQGQPKRRVIGTQRQQDRRGGLGRIPGCLPSSWGMPIRSGPICSS